MWSEVKEVGPKVVQPKKPTIQNFQKVSNSGPVKYVKPKPIWRPRQSQSLANLDHNQSLANLDHRQQGNSNLVTLGVSESWVLPSGQVDANSSDDGLMLMRVLDTPATGKKSTARCSSVLGIPDSSKAVFSGFSSSGAKETQGLGRWDAGFTGDLVISSAVAGIQPPMMKEGSPILCQQPWVDQNRFSPLSSLGFGLEAEVREGEAHEEEQSSGLVDFVGDFQPDFGLHILPWEASGVDVNGSNSGEKDNWVLDYEPLSRWEPLTQDSIEGTQVTESRPPSNWVSQLMKKFCKMVGFPIVKHEAQCLALFRILEQECLKVNNAMVSK